MLFKKNNKIHKISPLPDEKAVTIGRIGEDAAVEFLRRAGYTVIERNFRAGKNEIDIIATDKQYLVFVEVKSRTCDINGELTYGSPSSSVTYAKRQRTLSAAYEYMRRSGTNGKQPRMDVIEILFASAPKLSNTKEIVKINHITNAFGA
jgi:putative endonuclease